MRVATLLVSTACACNQVYGLEEPGLAPTMVADRDSDGVTDPEDDCPDQANHDQVDRDHDGIGDACDLCDACEPCGIGTDHDEDQDAIPDACDNCPSLANPDQANQDLDDLGDACDGASTIERRVLFDGFGTLADAWDPIGRWVLAVDAVISEPGPHPFGYRLSNLTAMITAGKPWSIEASFAVPPTPIAGDQVGPDAVDSLGLAIGLCFISFDGTRWAVRQVPVTVGPTAVIRYVGSGQGSTASCQVVGNAPVSDDLLQNKFPLAPQLYSEKTPVPFAYVEVIQ
jgi:hypothetical protein